VFGEKKIRERFLLPSLLNIYEYGAFGKNKNKKHFLWNDFYCQAY
jgi:hypothetical protein